jgi:integrase/recombinase XerD
LVRGGELRQLRLDDIDWKEGFLHIRHRRSDRERTLPLPREAGELLADYIRLERPQSIYREIFLTSLAPREPTWEPLLPPCATLMVRKGVTIKQAADVLGHQSIAITKVYVKLDKSLQCAALLLIRLLPPWFIFFKPP